VTENERERKRCWRCAARERGCWRRGRELDRERESEREREIGRGRERERGRERKRKRCWRCTVRGRGVGGEKEKEIITFFFLASVLAGLCVCTCMRVCTCGGMCLCEGRDVTGRIIIHAGRLHNHYYYYY